MRIIGRITNSIIIIVHVKEQTKQGVRFPGKAKELQVIQLLLIKLWCIVKTQYLNYFHLWSSPEGLEVAAEIIMKSLNLYLKLLITCITILIQRNTSMIELILSHRVLLKLISSNITMKKEGQSRNNQVWVWPRKRNYYVKFIRETRI
jgi:hypothetical protein